MIQNIWHKPTLGSNPLFFHFNYWYKPFSKNNFSYTLDNHELETFESMKNQDNMEYIHKFKEKENLYTYQLGPTKKYWDPFK